MAFDKSRIKDLDQVVISALELFSREKPPRLEIPEFRRPLVVGSGNAAVVGRILFHDREAVFADVGSFRQILNSTPGIDGAILVSATGSKGAQGIAKELNKRHIQTVLLTCNPGAPAGKFVEKAFVFPKQTEPYTYNTSNYLGMVFGKTGEDPGKILQHIRKLKIPQDLGNYDAFFMIIPEEFYLMRDLLLKKFGELFGPMVSARAFTLEEAKHGDTSIESDKELFVYFGKEKKLFGTRKLEIPLPKNADYGAMFAIAYYVIGNIQKQHPPYFKDNVESFCKRMSKVFGETIEPIVE